MNNTNSTLYGKYTGFCTRNGPAIVRENRRSQYLTTGFTILEVMVAMVIMGISIGIFFSTIGNSSRLRGKLDEHTKLLLLARAKTEEAFLGTLEKKYTTVNEKSVVDGTTKDGIRWKVCEISKLEADKEKTRQNTIDKHEDDVILLPKETRLITTQVEGININTISLVRKSIEDEEVISDK